MAAVHANDYQENMRRPNEGGRALYRKHWFAGLSLLLLTGICPTATHADGWPQEEGETFIGITYGSSSSNEVYRFDGATKFPTDNGGTTVRNYPLADRGLYLYGEHGLTGDLTVIMSLALKRSIITSPIERRATEGIGDIGIAARYRLLASGAHVLSARAGVTLPTGYRRDLTPPLGAGVPTIGLGLEYGYSFWPAPAYATLSIGYGLRPGIYSLSTLDDPETPFEPNYADQITTNSEIGYTLDERLLVRGLLRFLTTTRKDDNDFDVTHPPETERYLKVGGGFGLKVNDEVNITADLLVTPSGLKTSKSTDLFLGLSWKGSLFGGDDTVEGDDDEE